MPSSPFLLCSCFFLSTPLIYHHPSSFLSLPSNHSSTSYKLLSFQHLLHIPSHDIIRAASAQCTQELPFMPSLPCLLAQQYSFSPLSIFSFPSNPINSLYVRRFRVQPTVTTNTTYCHIQPLFIVSFLLQSATALIHVTLFSSLVYPLPLAIFNIIVTNTNIPPPPFQPVLSYS